MCFNTSRKIIQKYLSVLPVRNRRSNSIARFPKKAAEVVIAKIPTENPWEVFAWLPFGGWNECPEPEIMMAVGKYWFQKFGAVPAVISHDILEFVAQPLRDRSAAVGLALEQYAFCNDIIDQGCQEVCILADMLAKSSVWFFWWD